MARIATIERNTRETQIKLMLNLDGSGKVAINTGIGMYNHMLESFARHGQFDLEVTCNGDLHIDDHHSVEDVAICLGMAIDQALGDKAGITRTAHAYVPMDEALAFVALDLSGRAFHVLNFSWTNPSIGGLTCDLVEHVFESIAIHGRMNLHAKLEYGRNDHHKAEALFKALARALDSAAKHDPRLGDAIPSTKGVI
ncbi:imidazoleglycerol-phosphate dehydratase HisB [Herpetosiphon geysericola]|uniref:Imidazoleglycerol-phosphate dehydratase n=1 Tax=Herpetosiphon geysericola TaxID=70996 RepID=A0A0P6Y0E2_9CHLR|nr:imidazoleglycerol-phosphate dehydratase HisB [Herpetosiphon geysericola]KPL85392.1 imidazoleglycerol-phosphate dehydratase [Herpetosiphon geysericola]